MSEPLDPSKYHIMGSKQRKTILLITLLVFLIVLPTFGFFYYKYAVFRPNQADKEVSFEIKPGDSLEIIASGLYEKSVINSEFLFLFYVLSNKLDRNIQAGVYTIKAGINIVELGALIQHGVNDTKVTFLEGWRIEEFANEASKKLPSVDYRKFVALARNFEGYLYPDTYFINTEVTEDELFSLLTKTFEEKNKNLLDSDQLERAGLTKEQAIILASIVEREVVQVEDKRVVAGILINRMLEGQQLGADATTQYAVALRRLCPGVDALENSIEKAFLTDGCAVTTEELVAADWWPADLTQAELEYDSVFNTRKNALFPPRPISNFSSETLRAVINHVKTPYRYYLTDKDGNLHTAVTLEEHNSNVAKYLR